MMSDLLQLQQRLEEFFDLVDPPRRSRARELLLSLNSEEELYNLLEEEYGEFFRAKTSSPPPTGGGNSGHDNEEGDDEDDEEEDEKQCPVCKYGKECYRKNPVHFNEFAHPWLDKR